MAKYKKIVIGIDESYARTGIGISIDGELVRVSSLDFKGLKTPSEKRIHLAHIVNRILSKNISKANLIVIYCERIRTFTGGNGLRPGYLKSTGALIATIVDTAFLHGVEVYSIDTRSWKSQVIGTSTISKADQKFEKPEKAGAIKLITKLGFDVCIYDKDGNPKVHKRGKNAGKLYYDDDAADAGCISLYGFIDKDKQKLLRET